MSYFDPNVYNYEALKPEDQKLLDIYDLATEDALNRGFIIDDAMELSLDPEEDSTIDRIKREIAGEVFDGIEKYLASQRMMLIVSIMDNYPTEE